MTSPAGGRIVPGPNPDSHPMKSLAEYLGVAQDESQPLSDTSTAPSIAEADLETMSMKEFCRAILSSREYRASILQRITIGELPAQVEVMMYHYAGGKPTERVEVKTSRNELEDLTVEELEERALKLAAIARSMRESEHSEEAVH